MKVSIGLDEKALKSISEGLIRVFADEYVLYTKTRKAHWNLESPDFYSVHKFFESQFEEIDDKIDRVAERIRQLGHFPPATLGEIIKLTSLTEQTTEKNDSQGFIKDLLNDHESIIVTMRALVKQFADHGDDGTSDFICGLMEEHEKMAWFLRAHLA